MPKILREDPLFAIRSKRMLCAIGLEGAASAALGIFADQHLHF